MIATMMALAALQQREYPLNASFQYSGLPEFAGVSDTSLLVRSHSVVIELDGKTTRVSSVTELKNRTDKPLTFRIVIPRRRVGDAESGQADFMVRGSLGNRPVQFKPILDHGAVVNDGPKRVLYSSDLGSTVTVPPQATYGLRLAYVLPLGKAGVDQKMLATGYVLEGANSIGELQITYRTLRGAAFHPPAAKPDWEWESSGRGIFIKKMDFNPQGELSSVVFYPSGFDDIG